MTISNERDQILNALASFIAQRGGIEPGNYSDYASYRAEQRSVTQDRHHAEKLLAAVRWRTSIGVPELKEAFKRAFSGRLSYWPAGEIINHGGSHTSSSPYPRLDYCTGQYFPTEYRKAACAVLAAALWDYWRKGYTPERVEELATWNGGPGVGNVMRESARKEFGRTIQSRYFN